MFGHKRTHRQAALALLEQLVRALELARGHNQYRGRIVRQDRKLRLLIELSSRGQLPVVQYLQVRVIPPGNDPDDQPDALFRYGNAVVRLSEVGGLQAFVDHLTHIARRGRPFIRTELKQATYK